MGDSNSSSVHLNHWLILHFELVHSSLPSSEVRVQLDHIDAVQLINVVPDIRCCGWRPPCAVCMESHGRLLGVRLCRNSDWKGCDPQAKIKGGRPRDAWRGTKDDGLMNSWMNSKRLAQDKVEVRKFAGALCLRLGDREDNTKARKESHACMKQ
ncbi:hypothetical protein PoB_002130200 [Plakobranchus ocellatus]|uniref:Uncharacterized protein n=1 Tax=Plakobranchus ocellatus TaxID=259542 RepID=A0AAV3ZJR8_9GAST|nr:hypothetical protein PoB_002130200 [Plakobranchus ocellatus]